MGRFGIKGRCIVDRKKHREYPIRGFSTCSPKLWYDSSSGTFRCLQWHSWIFATVPNRRFQGYPLGDRQTFLRSPWSGRGVW